MKILAIACSDDTPQITLNKEAGIFEISGRSLPEDSPEFYRPVLEWIADYAKQPNSETYFIFKLEYTNTASTKLIHEILAALEIIEGVTIVWCYQQDDEDMEELGNELAALTDTRFELRKVV